MKIYTRDEFLKLPSGVMYSEIYNSHIFSGLYIKKECLDNDWNYESFIDQAEGWSTTEDIYNIAFDSESDKTSFKMNLYNKQHEGKFNNHQLFAVYEKEDVVRLLKRIVEVRVNYPEF